MICDISGNETVLESLRKLGHDTIFYISEYDATKAGVTNATEERMKMWLRDKGSTILVTELRYSRGWESSTVIVLQNFGANVDNICMRAVSNLTIIKADDIISQRKVENSARASDNEVHSISDYEDDQLSKTVRKCCNMMQE